MANETSGYEGVATEELEAEFEDQKTNPSYTTLEALLHAAQTNRVPKHDEVETAKHQRH